MASAEAKTVTVEQVIEVEETTVTLELSIEEAQVLRDIYHAAIAGNPYGRRELFANVAYALDEAGITPSVGFGLDKPDFEGVIQFKYSAD